MPTDPIEVIARTFFSHLLSDPGLRDEFSKIAPTDTQALTDLINRTVGTPQLDVSQLTQFEAAMETVRDQTSSQVSELLRAQIMTLGVIGH